MKNTVGLFRSVITKFIHNNMYLRLQRENSKSTVAVGVCSNLTVNKNAVPLTETGG